MTPTNRQRKNLVKLRDAAAMTGVHHATLRRRISEGELTGYRFGSRSLWVDLDELEALFHPVPAAQVRSHKRRPVVPVARA